MADKTLVEPTKGSVAAFAPGRIEFLGNHLDYNGGLVLGAAIDSGNLRPGQPARDNLVQLFSESFEDAVVETSLDGFHGIEGKTSWANYCLGVLKVMQEAGLAPDNGFSLTLKTNLPVSVGLSSSAALELATALAFSRLAERELSHKDLVRLCRKAENEFVGMPCGILDQATSAFGSKDHLVLIDCETESVYPSPRAGRQPALDHRFGHQARLGRFSLCRQGTQNAKKPFVSSRRRNPVKLLGECRRGGWSTKRTCPRNKKAGPARRW